jgi:hypothetical protein
MPPVAEAIEQCHLRTGPFGRSARKRLTACSGLLLE